MLPMETKLDSVEGDWCWSLLIETTSVGQDNDTILILPVAYA
jgi:hypothetical protein